MRSVSLAALGVVTLAGAIAAGGVFAQSVPLAKDERAALRAAQAALSGGDYSLAAPAIITAVNTAHSGYARYLAASLQLQLAERTGNRLLQAQAIQAMLESGAAPAASLEELYKNNGALALAANDPKKAEASFERWVEIAPNNPEALLALAEIKDVRKKGSESVPLIQRAIAAQQAAGKPVPESWYKRGLKQAFDAGLALPTAELGQALIAAYPSPTNWRDALLAWRDLYHADPAGQLDAMRLARSARALTGERDYLEYVQALDKGGVAAEQKAVLDEGVATKMVDPAKAQFKALIATAGKKTTTGKAQLASLQSKAMSASSGKLALDAGDAYFGYGQYAKAADLYRAAASKGSVDANIANTRLGMALALAGQRAEAEAALRSVTGPRAPLAAYWLVWLAQGSRAA